MKRATVENLAKRIGAYIDWDNSWITREEKHICIHAPYGKVFNSSASTALVLDWYSGPASEFWQMVYIDLSSGMSPDPDSEEERCHSICIPLLYIRLAYPPVMTDSEAFEYDEFCAAYWAEYGWNNDSFCSTFS